MNPLLLIAVPLGLVILGMILNSFGLSFAYPPTSQEQDPAKRVAAEKESYRKFFDLQRTQSKNRQKRVGQYGWVIMATFIAAFIWLYTDTVKKTILSTQVASMQTLGTEEGQEMVLSLTLTDGSNVKYLIKPSQTVKTETAAKSDVSIEKVSKWEMESLGNAVSTGDKSLPLGVALKISQAAAQAR